MTLKREDLRRYLFLLMILAPGKRRPELPRTGRFTQKDNDLIIEPSGKTQIDQLKLHTFLIKKDFKQIQDILILP